MVEEKKVKVDEKPNDAVEDKTSRAHQLVHRYMWWSLGAGLIPVTWLDVGVLAGVQLKMLHRLSKHYEVEFSENRGKSIIATLLGTITADSLRRGAFTSFLKAIPLVGIIGTISMPIYAGATTYAIGKLFILHFESGGTLLDFDPQKVKDSFTKLYEEGKMKVAGQKAK